jgi:hypothetical protein
VPETPGARQESVNLPTRFTDFYRTKGLPDIVEGSKKLS